MNKDEKIDDELKEISKKIEDIAVGTPDLITIVNFVSDEQGRIAASNNRQLAMFSCTALAIIAVLVIVYQMSALAFIIIHGLLLTVPVVLLLLMRRRRNELI